MCPALGEDPGTEHVPHPDTIGVDGQPEAFDENNPSTSPLDEFYGAGGAAATRRRLQDSGGGGTAVATARPWPRWARDFRYTNGARPFNAVGNTQRDHGIYHRAVVESFAGTFSFNAHSESICWYLDSQFCAPFHQLKAQMGSAQSVW